MREFKFRAWDKINKRLEEIDGYDLYLADGNVYEVYPDSFGYECAFEKKNVSDRYEIMQYTGIKDKNGKEIYEGDIAIANLKYFDIKNKKCKVIFKNGSFGLQYGYCDDYFKSFLAWDDYEVIGNIYENPELLEAHHG